MEDHKRLRQEYQLVVLQHQYDIIELALHQIRANRLGRRRQRRWVWVRLCIGRRQQFGLYDQLLVELRTEDQASFKNFMFPEMFNGLVARVGPRITKQQTWYREPLEPCMKLALTLRHFASGSKYASMKFVWRVLHNTQSLLVREVCQAVIDEYMDEVMICPTTPDGWRAIADRFYENWNSPPPPSYIWGT